MGTRLPDGVGNVLRERAHGNGVAPAGGEAGAGKQRDPAGDLVQGRDRHRGDSSAGERTVSLQVPARSAAGVADRAKVEILSEVRARIGPEDGEVVQALDRFERVLRIKF